MSGRLSICYAAPGHSLISTSGSARNLLSLAQALSQWADVTVAFREIAEPLGMDGLKEVAIEQRTSGTADALDDVATRGLNPVTHLSYLSTLRQFAKRSANSYDLVFEKGWRLSGYLSRAFNACDVQAVLVENDARRWSEPLTDLRSAARYVLHSAAQIFAGTCSRRLPLIIAETEELKEVLVKTRGISAARVEVVELGVDHTLFRPLDGETARASLGISPDATIMLYVGGMDAYHDLSPAIEALKHTAPPGLELHLVGDGQYRSRYQEKAQGLTTPVLFHGQVPHHDVPTYIAAADVCLAPYQTRGFYDNKVAFSTLKIPEYMACARPVISVPSGHILSLIEDEVSGFLFANDAQAWEAFLGALPSRSRFSDMGHAAAQRTAKMSWGTTAAKYLELGSSLLSDHGSILGAPGHGPH